MKLVESRVEKWFEIGQEWLRREYYWNWSKIGWENLENWLSVVETGQIRLNNGQEWLRIDCSDCNGVENGQKLVGKWLKIIKPKLSKIVANWTNIAWNVVDNGRNWLVVGQ